MEKRVSYGRIKEGTIGGIFMPRNYRHIQEYEREIIELRSEGYTGKEIQAKFGLSKKQYENFITRYNKKQKKIQAGIAIKRKGRC